MSENDFWEKLKYEIKKVNLSEHELLVFEVDCITSKILLTPQQYAKIKKFIESILSPESKFIILCNGITLKEALTKEQISMT